MPGIFDNLRQVRMNEHGTEVMGEKFDHNNPLNRFFAVMRPDSAHESGQLVAAKLGEQSYSVLLRLLHVRSIKDGIISDSRLGDQQQDLMREELSDIIRGFGSKFRRSGLDERYIVSFQMRLLGGVLKNLVESGYDQNVPLMRSFARSLLRKDFVELCTNSGVLPNISSEWLHEGGKAFLSGGKEKALEYIKQLSILDTSIFETSEKLSTE